MVLGIEVPYKLIFPHFAPPASRTGGINLAASSALRWVLSEALQCVACAALPSYNSPTSDSPTGRASNSGIDRRQIQWQSTCSSAMLLG